MARIIDIDGICPVRAEKLREASVRPTLILLSRVAVSRVAKNWQISLD